MQIEKAIIEQTNIPGLVNVYLPDGRYLNDLTRGQLSFVAAFEPAIALALAAPSTGEASS